MLSSEANYAEARTSSSFASFDHALRPDDTAFVRGCGLPMRAKLRRKRFGRTCWSLGAPDGACRPARRLIPRCFALQSERTWPTHHLSLGEGLSRESWLVLGFSHRFVLTGGCGFVAAWNPRWFPSSSTIWPFTPRADATAQTRDHMREGQASYSTSEQRKLLHDADKIRLSLLPCLVGRSLRALQANRTGRRPTPRRPGLTT